MRCCGLNIFLFFLFHIPTEFFAQETNYSVDQLGIKEGLTQNSVNTIYQDHNGLIWIGTQDGLNRFDGYRFTQFRKDPNNKFSLLDNFIIKIIGSQDSGLWIVTNEGLNNYNQNTNSFSPVLKNKLEQNSKFSIKIKTIIEGEKGILWLRTDDGIIEYHVGKKKFYEYLSPVETYENISNDNTFSLIFDNKYNLWSGSGNGLICFDTRTKQFSVYPLNNSEVFSVNKLTDKIFVVGTKSEAFYFYPMSGQFQKINSTLNLSCVKSIIKDKSNILWFGTQYGLMYLDTLKNSIIPFPLENYITDELKVGDIETIIIDNFGIVWVGTNYGIFKIDTRKKLFNLYRKNKDNFPNFSSNSVFSIYYDKTTNEIWFGTRGYGLNIYNRNNNRVSILNSGNSGLTDNSVHTIRKDETGNIWLGTDNGIFIVKPSSKKIIDFLKDKNYELKIFFTNNRITDIYFDDQIIWFSSFRGLLKFYSDGTYKIYKNTGDINSIIHERIFKVLKTERQELWIATYSGLSKLNLKNEVFTNYTVESGKISSNMVPYIFESSDSTIWIGTGTGLNKYIPEKDSFVYYTIQSHNFNNDFIYTITEDPYKSLWLSTNKGIVSFNPNTEEVHNFSLIDNLQDYEFNVGAVYNAGDELFWGGTKGINSLKPEKFLSRDNSPKPIITSIKIEYNNTIKSINPQNLRVMNLTWKENSFEIDFAIPEYTNPNNNTFKFRIKEKDNKWTYLGTNHSITFSELPPGTYTLQILGSSVNNRWSSESVDLIITISSPWWFTTASYIFYVLFIISIVGLFVYRHNRGIRKENKILQEKQIVARQVEQQKELLSIKNNNIAESMRYASRIINALLPSKFLINKLISDYFILYMSKEIVSGDFYWIHENNNKIIVAAGDSTGHGVPGAFMSIIGMELLRNILIKGIDKPSEILDELNKGIASVFKNEENTKEMKDGMDISVITISKNDNLIEFAGAVNQMYIFRDDHIIEIKGDRFSVSPASYRQYGKFTNHAMKIEDGDMIYLFSDGYIDQFGGPEEKKFKYRRFRNLLLNNYLKATDEQEKILKRVINSWRGNLEQVDDIMVIGIRINLKKMNL